jgi:hypothetical protein
VGGVALSYLKVVEKMASHEKNAALFVGTMLHSATVTHLQHFSTRSYAQHKALQKYYEAIPDLVDAYTEAYQGRHGLITGYDVEFHKHRDPKAYVKGLLDFLDEIKATLPKDSDLVNLFDAVVDAVTSLKYKLENLS